MTGSKSSGWEFGTFFKLIFKSCWGFALICVSCFIVWWIITAIIKIHDTHKIVLEIQKTLKK